MSLLFPLRVRRPGRAPAEGSRRSRSRPSVELLEGRALLSNLLANGHFELGDVGFTTQYPNIDMAGGYIIGRDPDADRLASFLSFGDHTTGTGLMDEVDGALIPDQVVWQETVAVSPGTNYTFSGWAATMVGLDPSPARLQFLVNGAPIGSDYPVPARGGSWSSFSATWNSGTAVVAKIQIFDRQTAYAGNDFALDDLSFRAIQAVASQLVVTAQPHGSVVAGSDFEVTVAAEDLFGNVDGTFRGAVAVALAGNPGGTALGGVLTATAQDGVATFSGLTLDRIGSGYTLSIAGGGLIPATTRAFDVVPAAVRAPTVAGFRCVGAQGRPTALVASFSEPMSAASAEDRGNYRLVWSGRDRRPGTGDDRAVPIHRARYDSESQSVVLQPIGRLPQHGMFQLTIVGTTPNGLTSLAGIPLDGTATGLPGSDYMVQFERTRTTAQPWWTGMRSQ
ncbi:hypothetical protein [Paludisphaera mucosa]|uniref:CBM-cenC domain-containing protein n=1 Tax=Paludisphaera mucosa TaxID=3030827 RepID=A0ABT6FKT8_9BACT|nr:hypothetical protein [Paludisphaera mucosa]MDG3008179.1 hypothetical protein [Paludisphaera mucosa]